ncbi:MAG: LEA type 2 family protein [Desulfopila sp.]
MKRYTTSRIFWLLTVVVLFLTAACAGLGSLEKPQISLADIEVMEVKTLEAAFMVQLRIVNPNDIPLDIAGLSCEVIVDGRTFASGAHGERQTIPAYGSALVPMEIYASMLNMFSSLLVMIDNQNKPGTGGKPIDYQLKGKVKVISGAFSRDLPFTSKGQLRL